MFAAYARFMLSRSHIVKLWVRWQLYWH